MNHLSEYLHPSVAEQLRQSFANLIEDENWHVTNVDVCTDTHYTEWVARYSNITGLYVVEITAMRDMNGPNKQGHYTKAPKGTRQLYTVAVLDGGQVVQLEWWSH